MAWRRCVVAAVVTAAGAAPAQGQTSDALDVLAAARGERVELRLEGGTTSAGTLTGSGPGWLEVSVREEVRRLSLAEVTRIDRVEQDGVADGALIGLAAGLGVGLAFSYAECGTLRTDDECAVILLGAVAMPVAGAAAAAGALIDRAIARRTTIFSREGPGTRLRTTLDVRPQRAALGLTVSY
jgi:hypothetical protein